MVVAVVSVVPDGAGQRRLDLVDVHRWQLAVRDARSFLSVLGREGGRARLERPPLFGLHPVPERPAASYRRLARYDCTGLIWLLQGRPVVALTADTAAIQVASGGILTYRKHNKPAYGPLGDSLDDGGRLMSENNPSIAPCVSTYANAVPPVSFGFTFRTVDVVAQ